MTRISRLTLFALNASLLAAGSVHAVTVVSLDRFVEAEASIFGRDTKTSDQLGRFNKSVDDRFGITSTILRVLGTQDTTLEFGGPGGEDLLGFGDGLGSIEQVSGFSAGSFIGGSHIDLTFTNATKFSLADLDLQRVGGNAQVVARLTEVGGVDLFNLTSATTDFSTMLALDPSKQYQLFIQAQAQNGGDKSATYAFSGLEIASASADVPEPATAGLLLLLGAGSLLVRRRRND